MKDAYSTAQRKIARAVLGYVKEQKGYTSYKAMALRSGTAVTTFYRLADRADEGGVTHRGTVEAISRLDEHLTPAFWSHAHQLYANNMQPEEAVKLAYAEQSPGGVLGGSVDEQCTQMAKITVDMLDADDERNFSAAAQLLADAWLRVHDGPTAPFPELLARLSFALGHRDLEALRATLSALAAPGASLEPGAGDPG